MILVNDNPVKPELNLKKMKVKGIEIVTGVSGKNIIMMRHMS